MSAMFVPADQAVRDAIRTRLDENICVEAGAGTGKTTVLVDRIVEMLRRGPSTVDRMAVITFTEKAAAELATRVRQGLEAALPGAGGEERERIEAALRGLSHAHIETIHAFAAGLLRERPIEAGVDPGFEVLDVLPAQLAFERAYDDWITAEMAQGQPRALLDALNLGLKFERVREAAELLDHHRDALPIGDYARVPVDIDALLEEMRNAVEELEQLRRDIIDPENETYKQIPTFADLYHELRGLRGDSAALYRLLASAERPNTQAGNRDDWRGNAGSRAKDALKRIRRAIEETLGALRRNATADLARWLEGFVEYYRRQRVSEGKADFDDLLIAARNLVRDNDEVRRYFAERYRHILVDEFQDTDPLQAELVVRLCAAEDPGAEWRRARLRPGSLFVVGDPKQSIYRFRRADITMYDDIKRAVFGGAVLEITQNFRSVQPVIDWANDVFHRLMATQPGVQPAYVPLVARPDIPVAHGAVDVLHDDGETAASAIRRAEAAAVAALIRDSVADGAWQVRDRDGSVRPASWRDIVVLVPTRTELFHYEDALARAEIPYRHEGGRAFFQRQEVRELIALLRSIDNASDQVACVAALRSSAFGCSDEELLQWKAGGGQFDYDRVPEDAAGPVADALRELRELAGARYELSLPDLVREVIERTRLVEFAMLQPQGEQGGANLLKVIDLARAFADAETAGLRGFVQWLKENIVREAAETDASISEESDDVVRVVTVHAAKGLEFPIVVFANMATSRNDRTNVLAGRGGGTPTVHLKLGATDAGFVTPGWDEADAAEDAHRDAEDVRLLYVAATRARDRLVVPLFGRAPRTSTARPSLSGLLRNAQVHARPTVDVAAIGPLPADVSTWRREPGAGTSPDAVVDAREMWAAARKALLEQASKGLVVQTASSLKDDAEEPWRFSPDDVRRGRATDFGTAVHAVLERIDLRSAEGLAAMARAVALELGLAGREREIEAVARNAIEHAVVRRALEARVLLREVSFTAPLPAGSGLAEGRIDLLFESDGAITVVDFKTDDVGESGLDERAALYRTQALVYAWAAARTTGMPVREVVFLFARVPATRAFTVDDAFMAEAESLLAAVPAA